MTIRTSSATQSSIAAERRGSEVEEVPTIERARFHFMRAADLIESHEGAERSLAHSSLAAGLVALATFEATHAELM